MSFLSSFCRQPIGVDIGSRLIKAVQLGHKRGRTVVTASARIGRTGSEDLLDQEEIGRLSRVFKQQGFTGRSVVLAVPSKHLMSSVIDMPPRHSGAPYEQIAAQELARLQRQVPGKFEYAWWDVPQPARASSAKVMAVACSHDDCDPVLDQFNDAGFDVMALDSGLCAIVRACRSLLGPASSVSAVLDIGWSSARLALVHGGVVVFERVLNSSGLAPLQGKVCKVLGVEPAEADALLQGVGLVQMDDPQAQQDARISAVSPLLGPILTAFLDEMADELQTSFEYTTHQYPDAETCRLVLAGGGACIPGVVAYLNERITPEVVAAEVSQTHNEPAVMASAMGLAGYRDQG